MNSIDGGSGADGKEYRAIHQLYVSGNYDAAIARMAFFEKKFVQSPQLPNVENLHGMAYLLTAKPQQAIFHFKRAIAEAQGNPTFVQYVYYNLGTAQFEAGQLDDCEQTLAEMHPDVLEKDTRQKAYYLKSRFYAKRGLQPEAAREALEASRLDGLSIQSSLTPALEQALAGIDQVTTLDTLYRDFEDSPLADLVLHRLATEEIAHGDRARGVAHLQMLVSRFPQSTKLSQAMDYLRFALIADTSVVEGRSIGLLLPLKGHKAALGTPIAQAIELGFNVFGAGANSSSENAGKSSTRASAPGAAAVPAETGPEPVTLVLEDSGDEPDQAVQALERLVFKDHVAAVIGPLMSKGIDQVTRRAEELQVPLISLARGSGVQGNYVFQAGLTQQFQAQQVARYAIQKMGLKRFAVLYPKDKLGSETANSFWDAVDALGGEMVGAESYNSGETDFRQQVDKLSGLYYTEARNRELEELAKERTENKIKKRTRKTEQYFSLKPIVDYDAVFIPDEVHTTGSIIPMFAYRDVDTVKFLGTSAWNFTEIAGISHSENAIFVDAFDFANPAANARAFLDDYKTTFGADPSVLEAVAYDAAKVLDAALALGPIRDRADLLARLQSVKNFPGVTGTISYDKGVYARDLKVFTVRSGRIVDAETAPALPAPKAAEPRAER
jgi:ABC-type branched-subunit amino acid transport system substrate-binding protein